MMLKMAGFPSPSGLSNIPVSTHIPHLSSSICPRPLRLLPCLGYCRCCDEHGGAFISLVTSFHFLWIYTQKVGFLVHCASCVFDCFEELPSYCFPWWLHPFTSPSRGLSFFSSSSQLSSSPSLLDDGHSNTCEINSHCGFNTLWHFPDC